MDQTTDRSADYETWRFWLAEQMNSLGRGARARAAFDLRVAAITISNALNGRGPKRPDVLKRLEGWLREASPGSFGG